MSIKSTTTTTTKIKIRTRRHYKKKKEVFSSRMRVINSILLRNLFFRRLVNKKRSIYNHDIIAISSLNDPVISVYAAVTFERTYGTSRFYLSRLVKATNTLSRANSVDKSITAVF